MMKIILLLKAIHFVTAIVSVLIAYVSFAASSSSTPSNAIAKSQRLENKQLMGEMPKVDNGVKIRQWFLLGISAACLVRLFCEILTLYIEEFHETDDQTNDLVAIATQLLPAQCYSLVYSYLASYFIRLYFSLHEYSCGYLHAGWFAVNVTYFVALVFCLVLKPWGSLVFGFVASYFFLIFVVLVFHGFGIAQYVSSMPTGFIPITHSKIEKRLRPLLYIASCTTLLSTAFYFCLFKMYLPPSWLSNVWAIWALELIPAIAIVWVVTGGQLKSNSHYPKKPLLTRQVTPTVPTPRLSSGNNPNSETVDFAISSSSSNLYNVTIDTFSLKKFNTTSYQSIPDGRLDEA